ncbi:toprim domain-containing protein [Actinokineospora enzanensis]|uniref:toprim domain-containing protein n=1 Tax=Actinokineospora enzanensis TaxID=155975 RepID=UPI00036D1EAE|nr:toprim domain-containing protein [Actinokineospora enzanensis]
MARLSAVQRKYLVDATRRYHASLPGSAAEEHLATRGLTAPSVVEKVDRFRLGYVDDPLPGHEQYRGMLAIPYLRLSPGREWSVVSLRFRCIDPDCGHEYHGKYNTIAGDRPRLYNTIEIIRNDDVIAVVEGEIDAVTSSICGVPAIGVPGADAWRPVFREALLGFETVYIIAEGDEAGLRFANTVAADLPNGRIVRLDDGHDVNSTVVDQGANAYKRRIAI